MFRGLIGLTWSAGDSSRASGALGDVGGVALIQGGLIAKALYTAKEVGGPLWSG